MSHSTIFCTIGQNLQNLSDVRSETCAVDSVFDIRGSCDPGLFVLSGTPVKCASSECT